MSGSIVAVARITETGLPLIYLNQVGGQDELVFDGASFVLQCRSLAGAPASRLRETVVTTHWQRGAAMAGAARRPDGAALEDGDEADYAACMLGLRDYVDKNGFQGVVLGLSGGVDSALSRRSASMRSAPSACAR